MACTNSPSLLRLGISCFSPSVQCTQRSRRWSIYASTANACGSCTINRSGRRFKLGFKKKTNKFLPTCRSPSTSRFFQLNEMTTEKKKKKTLRLYFLERRRTCVYFATEPVQKKEKGCVFNCVAPLHRLQTTTCTSSFAIDAAGERHLAATCTTCACTPSTGWCRRIVNDSTTKPEC
jgi:hypothetical protein